MLSKTQYINFARVFYWIGVLAFFAKPFIGFCVITPVHPPVRFNILVKIFSKRKQESDDNSEHSLISIQKNMADASATVFFRFTFLLSLLFPLLSALIYKNKGDYIRNTAVSINGNTVFLLNSALRI